MIQKIKSLLLSLSASFLLLAPAAGMAGTVYAADANIGGSLCKGAELDLSNPATGKSACTDSSGNFTNFVKKIINILSVIVGAVAVIMIIYGGFRYVTSAGNDSTVSSAKNTILYAIIGLIIVALAQVIVRFVLTGVSNGTS